MTTVNPSSGVSILCDCPYAGKTREIKGSSKSDGKKRNNMRKELKQTKEDITIARNVLMDTRRQLASLQRILSLELGWVVNPYIRTQTTWKDRVREESYLKSELIHLVDYLRMCDPRYINDSDVHPTKLSTSTEDLLSARQENTLKRLYHGYTIYQSENEKRVGAHLWEFLKLKENYENKLYCNKVMENEIASVKNKISEMQRQFLEDKCLIDYITEHHFKMKGCFSEVIPEKTVSNKDNQKTSIKDAEAEKFKKMWEESEREKKRMTDCLHALTKKLEFANQKVIRAENACSGNIIAFRILLRKLKEGILLSKIYPRKKAVFGKFSTIQFRTQRSQLEAAVYENNYLRAFLRKAVLSKTGDLKQFQNSLLSTAEKYRIILEDIRNSAAAALIPPPSPDIETPKKKKAK